MQARLLLLLSLLVKMHHLHQDFPVSIQCCNAWCHYALLCKAGMLGGATELSHRSCTTAELHFSRKAYTSLDLQL